MKSTILKILRTFILRNYNGEKKLTNQQKKICIYKQKKIFYHMNFFQNFLAFGLFIYLSQNSRFLDVFVKRFHIILKKFSAG